MITRRTLFATAAPAAVALSLADCTAAQIAQAQQQWSAFVDQVNSILAAGCSALPAFTVTAATIAAVADALYPGAGVAVAGIAGAVQAVANSICSVRPTAAASRFGIKRGSVIGVITVNGKTIPIVVNQVVAK